MTIIVMLVSLAVLLISGSIQFSRTSRENKTLKYEFINIIAHKFRTPLTHVKWSTDTLLAAETDAYKKEALSNIKNSNEKLIGLVNTLLETTDAENGSSGLYVFETVNLGDFVRIIGDNFKSLFREKNVSFTIQEHVPGLRVSIDKARLEYVLDTLFDNAYSYTPTGKNVEVVIGKSGRNAVISVTDSGIGIAPEDVSRVFEKFYRGDNAQRMDTEGFGVGLFLAQSIAKRLHGRIEASSQGPDMGSTFSVILPLKK